MITVYELDGSVHKFKNGKSWRVEQGILYVESYDGTEGAGFAHWRTVVHREGKRISGRGRGIA